MEIGEMLEISIIKVEHPGCLWGQTLQGPGVQQYEDLQVQMNLFYHDVNLDVEKLKPASLAEGQVCVVFWPVLKSWCRATVESLYLGSMSHRATCFLVDHGERVIINTEDVRAPLNKFLKLPFQVRRFKLARIHPMRLNVSVCSETAELVPSSHWDSSATKYLHNLIQASTLVEAVFCGTYEDCTAIELYLTIKNVKICVNDDLVVKRFACFSSEKDLVEQSGCVDRSPVSLAWDIFSSPNQILQMNGCCTVRPYQPHFLSGQSKRNNFLPRKEQLEQIPQDKSPVFGMKQCLPTGQNNAVEKPQNETKTYEVPDKAKLTKPLKKEPENVKQTGQEDKESTLAEQLSEKLNLLSTSENPTELKEPAVTPEPTARDQSACARLLQLLNPHPINSDSDCLDDNVVCDPSKGGVLVHSAIAINPCTTVSHAPITEQFRKFMLRRKYLVLGLAESYSWPSVARGCDTVLVCHNGDDPLSYMPPLLAQLQLASVFSALTAHTGPIAVILCPGWGKVESVLNVLEESQAAPNLHPAGLLLGLGKDEAKQAKIPNNCQLLVTTPFSFTRLLEEHCFLFLRLCHLVLDEAHELFARAPEQMSVILQHYQKVVCKEERTTCARQIVAVGTKWCQELEGVVRDHMVNPSIIISVTEEAALYGRVQQTVLMCLDCNKASVLLSSLDFSPSVPQKTLLIANSAEEVENIYKTVSNTAAFSLKVHEGLTYQFDFVIEQWKKDIGPGTQVVLVTTNDCLKALGIRDASCVVHYGFPSSPKLFGNRLFCMFKNFQNLSNQNCAESNLPAVRSVLLLSERNACHVSGVLRYLKRTHTRLPPELLQFANGVQLAKEEQKTDKPLCSYLKSLGFCRDSTVCPERHTINKTLDCPLHPGSGTIMVLPLYIKSANVYFGRIVNQKEDSYEKMAAEMNLYYAKDRRLAKEVMKGGMFAMQENDIHHRVCVTKVPDKGNQLFSSVIAYFVDEGRTQEVKSHQLLQLPAEFQSLPSQAVEIILCRAQPIDGESDWNPKVTRAVSLKIKGKTHLVKVMMCLGNTVWVDPMVRTTRLPGLKTFINEYNVHAEIMSTGMATTNAQHLDLLKSLYQEHLAFAEVEPNETNCESKVVSVQKMVQAAEEVLASTMKDEISSLHNGVDLKAENVEPCESSNKLKDHQLITSSRGSIKASLETPGIDDKQMVGFHPHMKWFQKEATVTLTVQLMNPVMQKCEFFSDRVVYSAYLNYHHYCANLELHSNIIIEQCSWEMKCNQPVIKLVKKDKAEWKTLLKYKSAFVSYDFDHIEDEDITASDGEFVENTGEEGYYMSSESDSD
ncbi:putative ATP-dependent RNA helicase TDRD12 [Trichomycterus rosablanca]|uniref:putative ATP-dependent RNA helicase TDRD12 n=1 Tax=Trichomycterus rosablanca TaxID=2290929 RepID=UPI002F34F7AC